ncbi:ribosome maturation factor RimM [Methylomicrobium sp. Wu6]|uniref:ribosome maturation factor RimM n=1 Tax=Methylomicrobium sp. Wu6 TaxID=3107928 RepID=UPI002DD6B235|nr:ribosome maturation factor RimM [Methylomicrobium sp. Wu6]MEC4747129.1 ribosome maturation factor RimM [Methylomicrobium sp. Wu6]
MTKEHDNTVDVGKISGVFGIKGWLKIFSYTSPKENILNYSPWLLIKKGETKMVEVVSGHQQGGGIVAQIKDVNDRNQAETLVGWEIFIHREQLPATSEGEYYWSDLLGLEVVTTGGVVLGVVDNLLETGANDVLIVKGERERAVPFIKGQVIVKIDREAGRITVDWDPDF